MVKKILLKIHNLEKIYNELVMALCPHRESSPGSIIFIVEGTKAKPIIGLRYPGKKVRRRDIKQMRKNSALWANLYDFEVVAYRNGKEIKGNQFTLSAFAEDFYKNKRDNEDFWKSVEEIYYNNTLLKEPPLTEGMDSKLFLLMLKWIWIQEDFNYRFDWEDVESPIKYVLETRTGTRTSKGAGRAKSFAVLVLLHFGYFSLEQVKKIIPSY